MLKLVCELLLGPLLVAVSTLVARRRGARVGGVISGFPAVVGPVLLIVAERHGSAAAAVAARGTLVGLVALAAFVLGYARAAQRTGWRVALLTGWASAAAVSIALAAWAQKLPLLADLAAAVTSLMLVYRLLADGTPGRPAAAPERAWAAAPQDLPLRMAATAMLVVVLSAAVPLLGPLAGGILAALPVLASVLAVFTHRGHGLPAAVSLLRGMLVGMTGFVGFCLAIAMLAPWAGVAPAFVAATMAALGLQALTLGSRIRSPALPRRA